MPLLFRNQADLVFGLVLVHPLLGLGHYQGLFRRNLDVVNGDGDSGGRGIPEPQVLNPVQHLCCFVVGQQPVQVGRQRIERGTVDELVLDPNGFGQAFIEHELVGQNRVELQTAHRGRVVPASVFASTDAPHVDGSTKIDLASLVCVPSLGNVLELASHASYVRPLFGSVRIRQVIAAHNHVQGGRHQRVARSR